MVCGRLLTAPESFPQRLVHFLIHIVANESLPSEPYPAFLNLEKRVSGRTLRVDVLFVPIKRDLAAQAGS
jgi:hypothetical protein